MEDAKCKAMISARQMISNKAESGQTSKSGFSVSGSGRMFPRWQGGCVGGGCACKVCRDYMGGPST